jgi:catechol-2,3-dioxygenase
MPRTGLTFSHIGLFVHDLGRMEGFYTRVLEFTVTDRGRLEGGPNGFMNLVFLSRDPDEHHQIVLVDGRPTTLSFNVINQLSLKADSLGTLREMHRRLQDEGLPDIRPVTHGNALSVYAPDPEGNRLELYVDLPWYVTQPMRVSVDMTQDDEALMAFVHDHARKLPGFRPRAQWRAEMAVRMGLVNDAG